MPSKRSRLSCRRSSCERLLRYYTLHTLRIDPCHGLLTAEIYYTHTQIGNGVSLAQAWTRGTRLAFVTDTLLHRLARAARPAPAAPDVPAVEQLPCPSSAAADAATLAGRAPVLDDVQAAYKDAAEELFSQLREAYLHFRRKSAALQQVREDDEEENERVQQLADIQFALDVITVRPGGHWLLVTSLLLRC
jgi:hypothetical protein